jgi:hypothetical protein
MWNGYEVLANPAVTDILPELHYTVYQWDQYKANKKLKEGTYPFYATSHTYNPPKFLDASYNFYHVDMKNCPNIRDYVNQIFTTDGTNKAICVIYTHEEMEDAKGNKYKPKYNLTFLDLFNVPKLSTIVLPPKEKQKRKQYKTDDSTVTVYQLRKTGWDSVVSDGAKQVPNTSGVYVIYDYEHRLIKDNSQANLNFIPLGQAFEFLGEEIWGITETRAKKLKSGWKTLIQAFDEKIANLYKEIPHTDLVNLCKNIPHNNYPQDRIAVDFLNSLTQPELKQLGDNHCIAEYLKLAKATKENYAKYGSFMDILRKYKKSTDLVIDTYGFEKNGAPLGQLEKKIYREYPLLCVLRSDSYKTAKASILEYIAYKDSVKLKESEDKNNKDKK